MLGAVARVLRRPVFCAWVAAIALFSGIGAGLAQQPASSGDVPTSVVPPVQPTEVSISAFLIGLSRVSEPSAAFPVFDVEMYVDLSWKDPRLAATANGGEVQIFQEEEAAEKLSEIWSPDPEIQNEIEQRQTESIELRIFPDGTVEYEERFGATVHAEFDLSRFPFDSQVLTLEFQSFLWDLRDTVFVADTESTGFDPDFTTPEWLLTGTDGKIDVQTEIRDDRAFSTYTFSINADRQSSHYVMRFLTPLMFVMALTWSAFWMPWEHRFRVGFIALLTVVASHTVISGTLPRLSYPTIADVVLLVCYLYATALIVVSLRIQRLEDSEDDALKERAARIDRWTRWLLPAGAIVGLSVAVFLLWH